MVHFLPWKINELYDWDEPSFQGKWVMGSGVFIIYLLLCFYMEKVMAPHSSTLAWKIPWTEEPGRLQSMGSLRVRHDWAISLSLSCIGEGNGNPLQCSCLENPRDGGGWWAAVYGVTQSRTWLKRLSSSSMEEKLYNTRCSLYVLLYIVSLWVLIGLYT